MTGKDIRRRIEKIGVPYNEVAERLGISPQALNSRLNAADVKVTFLEEVARAINKPLYWLLEDESLLDEANVVSERSAQYGYFPKQVDLSKRVDELEHRLQDKDETISALKKLVAAYERKVA